MASAKLEGESAKWTKSEVDIFVSVMVDEVIKGNKTSSTFNKAGWENIKKDCETKIGRPFSLRQLRNKMNKLRTDYGSFKRLLEQSGFGWCEKSGTAVPGNPAIWDDHIKANPAWAKWKKQGLPQWPQLCQIFVDSYATGEGGISNTQEHTMIGDDDDVEESDSGQSNAAKQPPNTIHKLDRTPSALRKKSKHGDLAMAINRMVDVSRAKLELFTSSGTSTSTPRTPKELFNHRHSSLRNVIERTFGVLKARFPILKSMPAYPIKIQAFIVLDCCAVHNFIKDEQEADKWFNGLRRYDALDADENDISMNLGGLSTNVADSGFQYGTAAEMNALKKSIAN